MDRFWPGEMRSFRVYVACCRIVHCWKGNDEDVVFGSNEWAQAIIEPGTCMLERGHDGPHEFVPDSQIGVTFPAKEKP